MPPEAPKPGPQTRRPWGYTVWGFWVLQAPHPVWVQEGQEPVPDPWPGVLACGGQGQGAQGQVILQEQPLRARPRAGRTVRLNWNWNCAQSHPTLPHSSQPPRDWNCSLSVPHQNPRPGLGGSCGAPRTASRQQRKQTRRPAQRGGLQGPQARRDPAECRAGAHSTLRSSGLRRPELQQSAACSDMERPRRERLLRAGGALGLQRRCSIRGTHEDRSPRPPPPRGHERTGHPIHHLPADT